VPDDGASTAHIQLGSRSVIGEKGALIDNSYASTQAAVSVWAGVDILSVLVGLQ